LDVCNVFRDFELDPDSLDGSVAYSEPSQLSETELELQAALWTDCLRKAKLRWAVIEEEWMTQEQSFATSLDGSYYSMSSPAVDSTTGSSSSWFTSSSSSRSSLTLQPSDSTSDSTLSPRVSGASDQAVDTVPLPSRLG